MHFCWDEILNIYYYYSVVVVVILTDTKLSFQAMVTTFQVGTIRSRLCVGQSQAGGVSKAS